MTCAYHTTFNDSCQYCREADPLQFLHPTNIQLAKLHAKIEKYRLTLRRIYLPDYVMKNDISHAYRVLNERMKWAGDALKEEGDWP